MANQNVVSMKALLEDGMQDMRRKKQILGGHNYGSSIYETAS